ncbi:MAG: helix-turn-helix transcriptional regulator [Anaerolineaceae bacterium]|nr:helix-turn-helix transcriptional regulator [Anaerolineaceae bacterium]
MDFNEKLQQLRKQKSMTQEQLAEELFISRTAVSKWESGKGYPNIDSLKNISKIFSVSIDDLLSGEELISLAESENHSNMIKVFNLIFGILDLMAIACIFLPLFGQPEGEFIRAVSLFGCHDISVLTRIIYLLMLILMLIMGIAELIILLFEKEKWLEFINTASILLHAFVVFVFVVTRQPYVTSFLFMLFLIKVVLLIKANRIK